jgi:putative ABC transport system permease protein
VTTIELVRLALSRLGASRLRSALTMLGVIIGVASVVALVAVGQGATSGVTARLSSLGTNLLTVTPGRVTQGLTRGTLGGATTLTQDDATAIAAIADVAAVAPEVSTSALVVAGSQNVTTSIIGTSPDYLSVRAYEVWQGAFLGQLAEDEALDVVVLGSTTADSLGLDGSSIGSTVQIAGRPYTLIGILQPKGASGATSQDDLAIVPITTARRYLVAGKSVRSISVSVASSATSSVVQAAISSELRSRHGLANTAVDDFTITDQAQLLSTVSSVTTLLTVLLAGIASISLIVGGIGIMNIMVVSVRERTREIGIRKAVGARDRDILFQFLIEALVVSILGGLIGIAIGLAASFGIGSVAGWGFVFSPVTVLAALAFSVLVGVVFGVWPARQASRLDPVEALHFQ